MNKMLPQKQEEHMGRMDPQLVEPIKEPKHQRPQAPSMSPKRIQDSASMGQMALLRRIQRMDNLQPISHVKSVKVCRDLAPTQRETLIQILRLGSGLERRELGIAVQTIFQKSKKITVYLALAYPNTANQACATTTSVTS